MMVMTDIFNIDEFLGKHGISKDSLSETEKFLICKIDEWGNADLRELIGDIDDLENYEQEEIYEAVIALQSKKLIHVIKEEFPRISLTLNTTPDSTPQNLPKFKLQL